MNPDLPEAENPAERNGYSLANAEKFGWSSISGELHPERRAHLEKYLIGPRVLDAGCGGGAFVHYLRLLGFDAYGADLYRQFLQVARERGFQGHFVRADLARLPFSDKTFDSLFCFDVLEHIVDDGAVVREFARVTRGRIVLAVPREDQELARTGLTFRHYQDKTHVRNYTDTSLEALVAPLNPRKIEIFTELEIPAREIALSVLLQEGWAADLSAIIAEEAAAVPAAPLPPLPPIPELPEVALPFGGPLQPLRYRVGRVEAVQSAVASAYSAQRDASRAVCEQTLRETETGIQALRAALAQKVYEAVVHRLEDAAAYRRIATGLVAVIDL